MDKQVTFTEATKRSICAVAQACAEDMDDESASNAEVVAEIALDANRLTIFGHKAADEEVHALVKTHGYDAVLSAAAKIVPTL